MNSEQILILILSIGFVILIILFVIALGTMIKILLDVRKVTDRIREEAENIGGTIDAVSSRAKSFVANSLVMDKIVPAIIGAIGVGLGVQEKKKSHHKRSTKRGESSKSTSDTEIFTEDETE